MPKREAMTRHARVSVGDRRLPLAALLLAVLVTLAPWGHGQAQADPATPRFGPVIEGYARYQPQTTCDPDPKPGVVSFRNLVLEAYPNTGAGSISRACNIGGRSEHKEGRAWDWGVNYTRRPHRRAARNMLDWLLRRRRQVNRHAMARRLGIMYVIWNRRMWTSWDQGWEVYCVQYAWACRDPDTGTAVHPHRDHMHISFSWPGARKNTSFWHPRKSFQ
jgi:hypothetical protein